MGKPAAKQGDTIEGQCTHNVLTGNTPGTEMIDFKGPLERGLSTSVKVQGKAAATVNSGATSTVHLYKTATAWSPPPPTGKGSVSSGSGTVKIGGQAAARSGDPATLCGGTGAVNASSTVNIGD